MSALSDYLHAERERQLNELVELVRFPTVSAAPAHDGDLRACSDWIARQLELIGLEHVQLLETGGHPVVYGDWLHAGPERPTALIYGHYDVQPAEPLELWDSPPFEPALREGRLYGRGASDCKAQVWLNVKALEALLAVHGALPCNVKLIVEGEEELRPEGLAAVVDAHAQLLAADVAVISDSTLFARDTPSISIGLRGMAALEVTLRTAGSDLHSGLYGGSVPNALHSMGQLVAGLHDPDSGRVAVEGFYDSVRDPTPDERAAWARLPFDPDALRVQLGVSELVGESGYTPLERLFARPTLDVHGAWGGFQDPGVKTIVPREAHLKLSCRLVPDQDPEEVLVLLRRHLDRHAPPATTVTVDHALAGSWPILTPADHPAPRAALDALQDVYECPPVMVRSGWSVPVTAMLKRQLGMDSLLLGFALPTDNAHAPNEHVDLATFFRGIRTMTAFWPRLAASWSPPS